MIIQPPGAAPAAACPPLTGPAGAVTPLAPAAESGRLTPAGLQDRRVLARRRAAFALINLASMALVVWGIGAALAPGGWSTAELVILVCVLIGAPWTVSGMWNALIGLWLIHGAREGMTAAVPCLPAAGAAGPLTTRTALAMTIRNEPPARAFRRLSLMRRALDETGHGQRFDIHVLSDTSDRGIAAEEERLFQQMRADLGGDRAHYRRRDRNTGYKAGNIREFLTGPGRAYDLYLPLDADSYVGAGTILRMVRVMEAHPRIGILQSMTLGMPSASLFGRALTFGNRVAARAYLTGASWWHGDTCFYWGHNALIRTVPFRRYCRLPVLPGEPPLGGHILSHDLPEAALMRRAGWECRVLPVEAESWEESPPGLPDFIRRDLRWCNGNMQATRLQTLRGLTALSRFHLFTAAAMYFGAPAWMLMALAAGWKVVTGEAGIDAAIGTAMLFAMLTVSIAPKLAGLADIALTPGGAARFGGPRRLASSAAAELALSMLIAPVIAFQVTVFLAGLAVGRRTGWGGQARDAYRVRWADAARRLWPPTAFGLALLAAGAASGGWIALAWAAPMLAGLVLAIPLAVATASPALGRWAARAGLCAIPEELAPPEALARLDAAEDRKLPRRPLKAA